MKKLLCVLLALLCLFSLTACGGGDDNSNDSGESGANVIKLGGSGPISDVAKIYGDAVLHGAELAVAEVNALGGGVQFDLNFEDDNHNPELARTAYYDLLDWGMQVSLATTTTKPAEEVAADYYNDDIFAITPSASGPKVTEFGKGNVYQMCFSDPNQGSASVDYIVNHNLATKVGVIYNSEDDYSIGVYEKFEAEAALKNLEIVYVGTFNEGDQDFNTQLSKAQAADADLLFLPFYYDKAYLVLEQADKMGYKPIFFGVDGMDGILSVENFDLSLAEGVYLLTPFSADATDEKTVNFVKRFKEEYGEVPIQFAADAYDCVYALYQACVNGNVTSDMSASEIAAIMKQQFTSMSFVGVTGTTVWNDKGEANKTPRAVIIENGVYVEK